jgi:hypothetical protein
MPVIIPRPPVKDDLMEWKRWADSVYARITGQATTSGDADATVPNNSTYHGVTALSAGRTLTLPPASKILDGDELLIQDESGSAGSHTITIQPQGSDTVNGVVSVSISTAYGRRRIVKNGAGKYFSA